MPGPVPPLYHVPGDPPGEPGDPPSSLHQELAEAIQARRRAEQALRESEERFRSVSRLSLDWFWEQDADLRFTAIAAEEQAIHFEGHDVVGLRRWELPDVTPLSTRWEDHRRALDLRLPFSNFTYVRRLASGALSYVAVSGEPVFDEGGGFRGYRGTARDITPAVLADQRIQSAHTMLRMAARLGRLGAWTLDARVPTLTWSDEVCALHQLEPGFAPTLEQAVAFYLPHERDRVRHAFAHCLHDGAPFDIEAELRTAQGRPVAVRLLGEAQWDAHGRVRRIQGAIQDVSASRQAAEQVRLLAGQLSTTLESITDAFFTLDSQWCFTYLNPQAERILRQPRAQLLGRNVWEAFPDLVGTPAHGHYLRAMQNQAAVQFEEYYPPLDLWVHVKAYPSRQGLAVYARDMTERVRTQNEILRLNAQLEERVRQRTEALQAANRDLESFSYSIAHDLRAPLSSIDGFSQVLEQNAGQVIEGRNLHFVRRIRNAVRHMGDLTEGLLALARLSRTALHRELVDLAVLARASLDICRSQEPGRRVDVVMPPSLPAEGDPRLLSQVVGNLVANAWKFTARTSPARIEIGTERVDGEAVYFVRDNGAGFDMAYAGKLFEAFQRLHPVSEFEGTGIGLAVVHRIVDRHGGRIWAEAQPGQGACFRFTLPGQRVPLR